jgi:Na+/H+-dicarboxylate symporter
MRRIQFPSAQLIERPLNSFAHLSDHLYGLIRRRLWLQVLVGMALGILAGTLLGPSVGLVEPRNAVTIGNWLAFPGQLFLLLIQMIVIPLVFASVVQGLAAGSGIAELKRLGARVTIYFILTTSTAITIGLAVALTLRPGTYIDGTALRASMGNANAANVATTPTLAELPQRILTLLPTNPLTSMVEGQMLQVILFAIVFGMALVMMTREQAQPMLDVLRSLQEVCMTVVRIAMRLTPFAVFGLLAQVTSKIGPNAIVGMAGYVATVLLGLLLLVGFYMIIVVVIARRNPVQFLRQSKDVLLLAFSTSSSAAVMPLSIKTAEEKMGVRPSVSHFVIPLGATINMDGTALYQGVAAIFLAQVFGVDISLGGMLLIILTAVGASIGAPATPGVGIIVLATVLNAVGIPVAGIALIIGVDRILDMSRTAVNVCGDLVASTVIDRWTPEPVTAIAAPAPEVE